MPLDPKEVHRRLQGMKARRSNHDTLWQEIADYTIPSRSFITTYAPGTKRSAKIFNTHGVLQLEQLAGGLHGMLTSSALSWMAIRPPPHLAQVRAVVAWFEAVTTILDGYFKSSAGGFAVALHEMYLDIAGPGSGVVFIADKGQQGPRFQSIPLSEAYYEENADRKVDILFREYTLPLREVMRLWPTTTPDRLRRISNERPDEPVIIVHATQPNDKGGWDTCWQTAMDYLEHGRYREFPFAVPRWTLRSGETYGTGCGVNALAAVKMLNKFVELNLRALAKLVDPPMLLPDDGFLSAPNMNPAAHNYFRADTRHIDKIGPLQTGGQPQLAFQYIKMVQEEISDIFYTTWLRLPQQPNMTATEVLQRRDELLRLLGPMVARLEDEALGPIIARAFAICARNGLFPPVPPELAQGGEWWVEFQGPLSRAQRLADLDTVLRFFAALQPLIQVDPTVAQHVHPGRTADYLASRSGMPALLLRTPDEIAAIQQQQAQQQQMAAQADALKSGAGAAKDGATALATIAGIGGGQQA